MSENTCDNCDSTGWVCENHDNRPWNGESSRDDACGCGAGALCGVCKGARTPYAKYALSTHDEAKKNLLKALGQTRRLGKGDYDICINTRD